MIGIIIQARTGSTRFPFKIIKEFYEKKSIIEIIIDKIKNNFNKLPIVIATTTNKNDDSIVEIAKRYNISFYRGSEENVIERFVETANVFNFNYVIRICADNPFLSVDYIEEIIHTHNQVPNIDYLSHSIVNSIPGIKSHLGLFSELVKVAALEKVINLTKEMRYYEHVTNYIYENPNIFKVKLLKANPIVFNRTDIRLTIDTKKDFDIAKLIYKNTDFNNIIDIVRYIDSNLEIKNTMKSQIKLFKK